MYKIGDSFETRHGTPYRIVGFGQDKRNKTVYVIEFPCGIRRSAYSHNIKNGKVKYPYDKNVAGVGFLGLASYKGNEKIYHVWRGILRRCYDPRRKDYLRYGGAGVTVCKEWFSFEKFLKDVPNLPGWDFDKFKRGEIQLDKDLLSVEGKIYSKETCCFLSPRMNNVLKYRGGAT
ncbi:hypothetical protein CXP43_16130 [Bacillus velezensis]|uniref:hypothetical protein n=1 Tax=Bacillus velezensis TaxID=492670 RepID=UPI000C6D05AC|nr:hypothetical protein [Bacillus velezensis]AUG37163.1 hypothetical protein CXP43_16130 [Bacillus velezensis]QRL10360.1 hypothetical protein GKO36_16080 [Bacillus velezensis]